MAWPKIVLAFVWRFFSRGRSIGVLNLTKIESGLLCGFIALVSFPLLYLGRQWDTNTLSSWRWVFTDRSISTIILFCLLAVAISFLLSTTAIFEKHPILWLFPLSFVSCASLWGEPELLLDSGRYFLQAKEVSEHGFFYFIRQWGDGIKAWTDMPLGPLLYGIIFSLAGESRLAIQLFNTVLFSLSTVLTYLSAQILIGKKNSFYAGLFLLGMPYLLTQVPLLLVDIHAMFFFSLAFYMFLAACNDGRTTRMVLAAVSIVLAMLAKYSTWPMLLILPLMVGQFWSQEWRGQFRRATCIFIFAALLAIVILSPKLSVIIEQLSILRNYQQPALLEWKEGLLSTLFFQIHPFITIFTSLSLISALQKGTIRLLLVGIFLLIIFYHIQRIRYSIPLFPLLAVMAADGVGTLRFPETRRFVCWLSVSFSFVILHAAYLPFFQSTCMSNIQRAGAYIDTLAADLIEVTTLPQQQSKTPTFITIPQLDLFTQKKIMSTQNWSSPETRPHGYHPLLFIWEMKKPSYYDSPRQGQNPKPIPLVVISGTPLTNSEVADFSEGKSLTMIKQFSNSSRVFRYKTFVTIFN